ncbi:GNAT family N-acetyltransferase [Halanaerobium praevalens]|uniref:GCN5-related N-acetyltransferase n=1 Tax=Halanaerobium praevalens (strain ATCC 33744 / DSM 2228 / GSL) TaxID=572479 RepID=E3DRM8_HALPG|nr:GNAT family N-acetyltransferase [Halanaerobium praevalens]ADO77069.1 GCN5-related N-acetyltransferase [Halanaerobium praevalens DSM 2228]
MKDNKSKFKIRFAKEEDSQLILKFIKELADYEKLLDQVEATTEKIKESIFEKKQAEVLIAEVDKKAVGFALFFHNYSTFLGWANLYLEDLYVIPEARGQGYGKKLFKKLAEIAVDRGCKRLDWWCLDWNQSSIDFYKSIGAKAMDEWTVYRLEDQALKKMAK